MSEHAEPTRSVPAGAAHATLQDVDIRWDLDARPLRRPDYEREDRAFGEVAREMAEHPSNMLQKLAETALSLCRADTAGISVLDGDLFRWQAVAGVFADARGGTMPRDASPCGVCIDADSTQLMHLPDRCFPALRAEPRFVETLLVPFHHRGRAIGTVWIVSHSVEKQFDREDERNVRVLARFVSAGWELWKNCEAAAEAGRRKDDFLAVLGHELRNPLAAITAAAAVLEERISGDKNASRAIALIARQCAHTTRLADELLDVARIGAGKMELVRKRVDLRTIVAETIEARRSQIDRRQQKLSIDIGHEPVWVDGDAVRLAQVLSNLLDNAAKYTPEKGRISVAVKTEAADVTVEVQDTGMGIEPDEMARIFEPMTQLLESRAASAGGLGLGLSLVRGITELHGGTVLVKSTGAGGGSSFSVRLPMQAADTA